MKKVLLICNDSNSVVNFRTELILFLKRKFIDVFVIAADDSRREEIEKMGVIFFCVPFSNRSKNPFSSFSLIKRFHKIIKKISPDIIFTFQLKPNVFGTMASKKYGHAQIYCMIEGLGDPFQPTRFFDYLTMLAVIALYRISFRFAKKVFVLNKEDYSEVIKYKIVDEKKLVLINGIGIDTSKFTPEYKLPLKKTVSMFSRLIKNKGIYDFCKIARKVRNMRPDVVFKIYGLEAQIKKGDLQSYIDDGSISYEGYTNDSISAILGSTIVCSTSYREGFPRVIMEAMSLGRPVVASDVIGNNSVVVPNVTGYLCPIHDTDAFVNCIIDLIDDDKRIIELGKNGRLECLNKYDSSIINSFIFNVINLE